MISLKTLHRIFRCPPARHQVAQRRPAQGCRRRHLALEVLEDRTLLSVSLVPDQTASHLVGDPIAWTATADASMTAPVYQFRVGPAGGSLHVVQDFSPQNSFTWAPMQEGNYVVQVVVKDGFEAQSTEDAVASYTVNSRVTGSSAVITATSNPLVALYSAPPSGPGTMLVQFAVASPNPSWQSTNTLTTVPGESTNFLVAGLLPNTTYEMRDVLSNGTTSTISAPLYFTTGSLPADLTFPSLTMQQPPGPGSDLSQGMVFYSFPADSGVAVLATDLTGHVEWYYDQAQSGLPYATPTSLVPGGTVLLLGQTLGNSDDPIENDVIREVDLAGNTLRETNQDAVNAQLEAMGQQPIIGFDHDAQRLPNGDTAVIASTIRTVDINGTPTQYLGNDIIVLDQNFQVVWVWDAFNYLDGNRGPTLGDVGAEGAVDWLHANSVAWSPADGDLVVSLRAQDWVIKIDYRNGGGDGHVVWRLGEGGDFTINSSDPNPWFSHQHDVRYINDTTLILFDDGNTRQASDPNADSRGQVLVLNEQTMQATLALNVDLGNYSLALGSAQRLPNGNFVFTSGAQFGPDGNAFGQSIEVLPNGTQTWVMEVPEILYRSYRISDLYNGISGVAGQAQAPAAPSGLSAQVVGTSEIDLTWVLDSTTETGFKVLRSTDGVHFTQVGTVPTGVTVFADKGLSANTTYYYQVVASNAFGDSAPSNTVAATTPGQAPTGSPPPAGSPPPPSTPGPAPASLEQALLASIGAIELGLAVDLSLPVLFSGVSTPDQATDIFFSALGLLGDELALLEDVTAAFMEGPVLVSSPSQAALLAADILRLTADISTNPLVVATAGP